MKKSISVGLEYMKKIIAISILFLLISYILININPFSSAVSQKLDSDISKIDTKQYPGIKESIQELQKQHPKWKFKILYTNLSWDEVLKKEFVGHGSSPKNLVASSFSKNWICPTCGDKPYDNGSWRCASKEAIAYMMDPRNILNGVNIFQFEELTSESSDVKVVKSMTKGTYLEGHEKGIVKVGNQNGVNAYYIVARLIQEQGRDGSELVSGKTGYYNAFNIGASGKTNDEVIANGLAYAKKKGWDTLEKSINGGIEFVAENYIKKGQSTIYLQKFNVTSKDTFAHQYQQNLTAAQTEAAELRDTYIDIDAYNSEHTFIIPVYKNMPKTATKSPDGGAAPTAEAELVRVNVNSSLKIRKSPTDSTAVGWLWKDEIAVRLEKATKKIGGTYWDKVQKADGTEGYTARETFDNESEYKLYLVPLNVDTGNSESDNNNDNNIKQSDKLKVDEKNKIITVLPGVIAQDILDAFGGPTKITKQDKSFLDNEQSVIGTGYIVEDKYTVVKKGDTNGDGYVDTGDTFMLKCVVKKTKKFSDKYYKSSGDVNNDGYIDTGDTFVLKKEVKNIPSIVL